MQKLLILILVPILIILANCSKKQTKVDIIENATLDSQMISAYKDGMIKLENGFPLLAAKKFSEAEILYPQSLWAPRSAIMTAYCYYLNTSYIDAISELDRYLKTYPLHDRRSYAYYLLALSYYEQIVDEKKDLQSLLKAKENFLLISKNYPNTDYAIDASFKLDLINDILASKEMYIGRYYFEKKKWISAINRFRTVIDQYNTTIYTEEALHRLVEIHYTLGLEDEAEKYAQLLGYNFQSSKWYEKTYILFDRNYELNKNKNRKKEKKTNSLIKRIKSLLK